MMIVEVKKIQLDHVRFTFYSEYSFKLEYSPEGKFSDKELFITDLNNVLFIEPTVTEHGGLFSIDTGFLKIAYNSAIKEITRESLLVTYPFGLKNYVWRYGQVDDQNLKGSTTDLLKFPETDCSISLTDGVLSRNGYYVYEDYSQVYWSDDRDWAVLDDSSGYKTIFFIGYGKDFRRGLKEFSKIFGKAPIPPRWVFGYWYSKWARFYQDDYVALVERFRNMKVPIDGIVVDTSWHKIHPYFEMSWRSGWRGYDWEPRYFSEPDRFIAQMKERGIKLTLSDHAGFWGKAEPIVHIDSHFDTLIEATGATPEEETVEYKGNHVNLKTWTADWQDKEQMDIYSEILLKEKLRDGIDVWWIDGVVAPVFPRDAIRNNDELLDFYRQHALDLNKSKSFNAHLWANFVYHRAAKQLDGEKRSLVLTRWGGIGSHRYPLWFSGDTYSDWETLEYEVYFTYTAGNVLTNYWSHDISGHFAQGGNIKLHKIFTRWIQFGAFSPIMRTHGCLGTIREPWEIDNDTVDTFTKYVRLRYRLVPFWYTLSYESYQEAVPMVRGMYLEFPEDDNAYAYKYQYMIGPSILVAPVTKDSDKKDIYFPEGEWISIETDETVRGKLTKSYDVPLSIIPFYIKKGSILPIAQEMNYIGEKDESILQFEVFPDKKQAVFTYYEDDGIYEGYTRGEFIQIPITAVEEEGSIIVEIGEQSGAYQTMPANRIIHVIIHMSGEQTLRGAASAGKDIALIKENYVFGEINTRFASYKVTVEYAGLPVCVEFEKQL